MTAADLQTTSSAAAVYMLACSFAFAIKQYPVFIICACSLAIFLRQSCVVPCRLYFDERFSTGFCGIRTQRVHHLNDRLSTTLSDDNWLREIDDRRKNIVGTRAERTSKSFYTFPLNDAFFSFRMPATPVVRFVLRHRRPLSLF